MDEPAHSKKLLLAASRPNMCCIRHHREILNTVAHSIAVDFNELEISEISLGWSCPHSLYWCLKFKQRQIPKTWEISPRLPDWRERNRPALRLIYWPWASYVSSVDSVVLVIAMWRGSPLAWRCRFMCLLTTSWGYTKQVRLIDLDLVAQ